MIDVVNLPIIRGSVSTNVSVRDGVASMSRGSRIGDIGTVEFETLSPSSVPTWVSAELSSVNDYGTGSVRVRISDGNSSFYATGDGRLARVSVDDWNSQFMSAHDIRSIDLWTGSSLKVLVALVVTDGCRNPMVGSLSVVVDLPSWEGAVAQAVRGIASLASGIRPALFHDDRPSARTSSWAIGNDYSEHGYDLTGIRSFTVDGRVRSADLLDGVLTVRGDPVEPGSTVRMALEYAPSVTVKRAAESRYVHRTPAFVLTNLVADGGMNGRMPPVNVGGVEVRREMIDLQVRIRGISHRQADALAMRTAMIEAFERPSPIELDSGRIVYANLYGTVEVMPGGSDSVPEATCVVRSPFMENRTAVRVSNPRKSDGSPMRNVLVMRFSDLTAEFTESDSMTNVSCDCQLGG